MRYKLKSELLDTRDMTYLNFSLDRSQILLELYQCEVQFQFAKIELANIYMDLFEHSCDRSTIENIGQKLVNLCSLRPNINFGNTYFSFDYNLHCKALEAQADLVCRIFKHTKLDNRSFISRHWGDKYAAMTSASRRGSFVVPVSQKQSGDNFRLRVQPTLNVSGSESKVKQSPLDSGLPIINDGLESFSVTMHHPSIAVNITEFVPNISLIVDIITINTLCVDELYVAIRSLFPEQHVIHGAVASLWFRSAQNMWRTLEEFNFEIPRSRRLLQGLEADILLGNPFLPDILLEEHYNKLRESNGTIGGTIEVDRDCQEVNSTIRFLFDELSYKTFGNLTNNITNTPERTDILQNPHKEDDAENQNKLGVLTYINNPQFQQHGKTALSLLYKVILLQKRIIHSWSESEFWRRACSNQIQQMALQKENYVMRLSSLRFDMLDIEDRNAIEDDVEDDLEQEMNFKLSSASARPSAIYSPDTIMPMQSSGYNSALTDCRIEFSQLRFSGLAITELDEDAERTPFDVCTIDGLKSILLDSNITRLLRTLKVQMLEKVYYTSIVEVQDLLMAEIHKNTLLDQIERVFKSKDKTKIQMISNLDHNFKPFVLSWIPKKKLLRRALAQEYAKLHKLVHITETREAKREEQLKTCRGNLIDWYYKNLCEIVVEEYERAEFAKLIEYMKLQIIDSAYGKLIFKYSKIAKISDYFTSQEKGNINEIEIESIQSSETQGVTITDIHGTEKLSRLWYLPHISEIILNMNGSDKVSKVVGSPHSREWGPEAIHTWPLIFRNSLVFQCSTDLQTLIFELFQLICTSSKYVQDNSKNMDSVKSLREAEYVVTVLNSMKKDLSFQGDNAEYSRVQAYLQTRWNLWILRVKAILSTSIYGLEMEMMSAAQSELQRAHSILSLKQHQSSSYFLEKLINIPKRFIKPRLLNIPSKFVFVLGTGYSETATKICCQNVQTLEETLDREEMSVALTFGSDSQEEIAKIQSEYLLALLKLLALRREFILLMFHGKMIQNKSQLAEYLKLYKYRIIVPSVKLYHRIGAKGNASTAYLLNDKIVRATIDTEFNPIAQASFDKCQTLILQSELLREYTQQLLKYAKLFYENLLDECMGRAFKIYDSRDIPMSEDCKYAYKLSEDDYESKLQIFEQFIGDLAKAKLALLKSLRDESKNVKGVRKTELQGTYTRLAEDSLFACGKKELSQALVQFARQIVQYNEKRNIEREHFSHMIQAQMLEIIQNSERLNNYLIQEKKELEAQYKIDLRIGVAKQTWDISVAHALLAVELNDLRKARRVDEKKIRLKVIEEYEELVSELLSELNFVRNRFSEFRTNAVSEILMIMSEAKKEELKSLIINQEIPHSMKSSTEAAVFREEHISELLDQISTLKMALKKYRAFSILKENTVKNAYEKKMRKLVEDSKRAEEKLWDSYKDAEARERTLRKQLTRATKAQATAESQNESLTRLLKEEQQKVQQLLLNKPNTANDSKDPSTSINKGLKASPMDVRGLLKELDEKTRIIEQLVQKQTVTQALPTQRPTPNQRKRPASSFARFSSIASESRHKRVETTSSSSSQSSDNPLLNRPMSRALVRPKSAATVIKRPTSALGQGTQRISSTTAVGSSHVGPSAQQLQAAINEETIKKLIGISKSSQQLQSILEQHGIHFQDLKNEGNKEQPKHKERRARSAGSRSSKVSQFQRSQASIEALNASHEPISLTGRQEQNEEKDKQGQTSTDTEATAEAETSNLDRRENELKRGTENQSDIVSSSAAGNRKRFVAFVDSSPSAMVRGGQPESRRPHSAQISVSSTPRFGVGRSRPGSALRSSTTGLVVTNRPPRPSTAPPLRQHDPRTDSFD
ncbi:hypothetical protein BJ742DRAFT_377219 [Cladochytrium replicatum]|nr:hypothetical protein BJ742DRAFT_377219 [Cladochytrium replicatum]